MLLNLAPIKRIVFILILILVSTPLYPCRTEAFKKYAGVGLGYSVLLPVHYDAENYYRNVEAETFYPNSGHDTIAKKLFWGFEITPRYAVEFGFIDFSFLYRQTLPDGYFPDVIEYNEMNNHMTIDFGTYNFQGMSEIQLKALSTSIITQFDITQRISLFHKLGIHFWEAFLRHNFMGGDISNQRNTGGILLSSDKTGTGLLVGIGLKYKIAEQISLRSEAELYMDAARDTKLVLEEGGRRFYCYNILEPPNVPDAEKPYVCDYGSGTFTFSGANISVFSVGLQYDF